MESTAPRHLAEPGEGPASPGTVDAALAAVTALLPGGGEARAGQVAMAEAVATAIEGGRHLIVSAGTGTGKSLGYLVPAALSGKRVGVFGTPTTAAGIARVLRDELGLTAGLIERSLETRGANGKTMRKPGGSPSARARRP